MAQDSHFLGLPTEIRLHIYEYLYEPPEGQYPVEASFPIWGPAPIWLHKLELCRENLYSACDSTKRAFWSMLQVSKLIHQELQDLLFERMLFTIFVTNKLLDGSESPSPPKLGLAKDFHFWQRARRILLVSADHDSRSMKDLIRDLGKGFRYFKSNPYDTTAFLYMHDELEFDVAEIDTKCWKRSLKSLASLSKRAEFEFEFRFRSSVNAREGMLELADATNGSATLFTVKYCHPGIPRAGSEEIVVSCERFRSGSKTDVKLSPDVANKGRIVCLMSSEARLYAGRRMALKRRRGSILLKKQLFEG
jgi:hypothetical protein